MAAKATRTSGVAVNASTTLELPPLARTSMLRLIRHGLSATEAGNIAALAIGLRPVAGAWTSHEIERLCFLRYLSDSGRLAH